VNHEKLDKLRAVSLRILPAIVLVLALLLPLAAPASAAGFQYKDYLLLETDGETVYHTASSIPITEAEWYLYGYPSGDYIGTTKNPGYFLVDHSQFSTDHSYTLKCSVFGSKGIDLSNIRNGSKFDFRFTFETSIEDYEFEQVSLELSFWTADYQLISYESYDYSGITNFGILNFYDLMIYPDGADHMCVNVFFYAYSPFYYQDDSNVGFAVNDARVDIYQPKSVFNVNLYDYSGQTLISSFKDVEFPCTVRVHESGFTISNFGSDATVYRYDHTGDAAFLGVSQIAYNRDVWWPPGSTFELSQPSSLYLMLDTTPTGYIEIANYSGSYVMQRIYEVNFPCTVRVASDGLYFTYADSETVDYFFPFGSVTDYEGVSLSAASTEVQYPIGSTFTLSWDSYIYLIREDEIPVLDVGDPGDGSDGELDVDSSTVGNWFQDILYNLDIPFGQTLRLFWNSTLLNNLLVQATLFALISFVLFGKKG